MLTNGRIWRLYFKGALSVAEDFLEIDLGKVLDLPGCEPDLLDKRPDAFADDAVWRAHVLKLFVLIFGRDGFLPDHRGETFHQLALREGKQWEARVARDLSETVFDEVFPALAEALATADGKAAGALDAAYLDEVREGALILLYRLLFVLYAEDRNLLPDESGPYADYSLTQLRGEIAEKKARGAAFSDRMKAYWSRLDGVFQAIAHGDDELGIPPYNGGLFDPPPRRSSARVQLPDAVVADIVFRLSHIDAGDGRAPKYINYRDLSVQQLGSVYERILEHGLKVEDGRVVVAENPAARKDSGSYYTPEELVTLIIERAVGPLVAERVEAFTAKAASAREPTRRAKEARLAELAPLDPASRLLDLQDLRSRHGLGPFPRQPRRLARRPRARRDGRSGGGRRPSPPTSRRLPAASQAIRARILAEAKAHGWPIAEAQLDDRHIVRRMVLKRVVYGVDKNPMAVELAKVALWLHSFTVGAPLSFLDHHLRCGDSVVGAWARPTVEALKARGALFNMGAIASVEQRRARDGADRGEDRQRHRRGRRPRRTPSASSRRRRRRSPRCSPLLTAERLMGVFDGAPKKAPPAAREDGGQVGRSSSAPGASRSRAFEAASALRPRARRRVRRSGQDRRRRDADRAAGTGRAARPPPGGRGRPQSSLFPRISVDDRRRVLADRLVEEARARAERAWLLPLGDRFPERLVEPALGRAEGRLRRGDRQPALCAPGASGRRGEARAEGGLRRLRRHGRPLRLFLRAGPAPAAPRRPPDLRRHEQVAEGRLCRGAARPLREQGRGRVRRRFRPRQALLPGCRRVPVRDRGAQAACRASRRRPTREVCVIPREAVPQKGLSAAVAAATYPLPRAHFTKESWTLEPPDVVALLNKIKRNGVPLAEYAGVKPYRGVLTGLNEAFLIDTPTRDRSCGTIQPARRSSSPTLRGRTSSGGGRRRRPAHDRLEIEQRSSLAVGRRALTKPRPRGVSRKPFRRSTRA